MNSPDTEPQPQRQALPAGTRLEEFIIEKVLGAGGFGVTYLARDVSLDRLVVIKENLPVQFAFRDPHSLTVSPRHSHGEDAENFAWSLENFSKEAAMLASLDHPGIVRVLRRFEAFGTAYFVMPFVDGESLDELMRSRRAQDQAFDSDEITGLLEHILEALAYLHERGIYHRDIKPGNILVTKNGVPVLIDFGSARQRLSERSMTVVESAGYTPFEQLQSRGNVGPWSDLYALGATVTKLVIGELPPKAMDRMRHDPFELLVERPALKGIFSHSLLASIDKALRVDEGERWQNAQEWLAALNGDAASSHPHGDARRESPKPVGVPSPHKTKRVRSADSDPSSLPPARKSIGSRARLVWAAAIIVAASAVWGITHVQQHDPQARQRDRIEEQQLAQQNAEAERLKRERDDARQERHLEGNNANDTFAGQQAGDAKTISNVKLRWCPPGTFTKGSSPEEQKMAEKLGVNARNERQHEVTLTHGFWLGETPVTYGQWKAVMGSSRTMEAQVLLAFQDDTKYQLGDKEQTLRDFWNRDQNSSPKSLLSSSITDDLPMIYVNWDEAVEYCEKLTTSARAVEAIPAHWEFRLPTEAQWEYACRAGTKTATYAGEMEILGEHNAPILDNIAWYGGNSSVGFSGESPWNSANWNETQHPGGYTFARQVGQKDPNPWGLRDTIGNVWEWCADWYGAYPRGPVIDPTGPTGYTPGNLRVRRGGSWGSVAAHCRAAFSGGITPGIRIFNLGFRPALVPSE